MKLFILFIALSVLFFGGSCYLCDAAGRAHGGALISAYVVAQYCTLGASLMLLWLALVSIYEMVRGPRRPNINADNIEARARKEPW
jgi:hypothetical protein